MQPASYSFLLELQLFQVHQVELRKHLAVKMHRMSDKKRICNIREVTGRNNS